MRDLRSWFVQHAAAIALRQGLTTPLSIESSGLVWMAVHGAISLALRHPAYSGPSRQLLLCFVRQLGITLVDCGVLTAEELEVVENFEREQSPHGRE